LLDFEVVVVDDGSSDGTADIVERACTRDPRLRLLRRRRRGLVAALNVGLSACRAPLVARLDADDLAHPERLALQCAYLEREPSIAVVGSRVRVFPDWFVGKGFRAYLRWQNGCLTPEQHATEIFLEAPLVHPSVMMRRDVVVTAGGYREGPFPEDYELWLRLVAGGAQLAKLPRVLLDWRQDPASLSRTDSRYAREAFDRLRAEYLARDPRLRDGRPLAVWGAGRRTRRRVRHLWELGLRPDLWIDVDPRKVGNRLDGVPVVAPGALGAGCPVGQPSVHRSAGRAFVLVYVARHGARQRIGAWLESAGYRSGADYLQVG
jgi:glycosyltransferase involved in cell wall biosynthesis